MDWQKILAQIKQPPREFSLIPFWFLNDELVEKQIISNLEDFVQHGVFGVIPHPRIGLPESISFMSERWLYYLDIIIKQAQRLGMKVILYDEGMYPSGSCAGKVVQSNPRFASRALVRRVKGIKTLAEDEELIYETEEYEIVHTRSMGTIRGIHYGMDDKETKAQPSADILNPEAVDTFIRLVHEVYYEKFKDYFGSTIIGIFTDEPNPLGRNPVKNSVPWTWGMLDFAKDVLGYDFREQIPKLWDEEKADVIKIRRDFNRVVQKRLEAVYYKRCSEWCERHGIALTGHPHGPMDIGVQKYFHIPGQDIVWRRVEPYRDSAIEGPESTVPKCSASAKVHHNRARNMNECFGAYGWELTKEEMEWLTGWLLVRGVDLLVPHAFYYSIRGVRREERPPDVGPHNIWWGEYRIYADKCRRLCWIISSGTPVVDVAVLADVDYLPWRASRVLFEHQIDFFYLDFNTLIDLAKVGDTLDVGKMKYSILIVDGFTDLPQEVLEKVRRFAEKGTVIFYGDRPVNLEPVFSYAGTSAELVEQIRNKIAPDVFLYPSCPSVRYHHTVFGGYHWYIFFNEGREVVDAKLSVREKGDFHWIDLETGEEKLCTRNNQLRLDSGEISLMVVSIN